MKKLIDGCLRVAQYMTSLTIVLTYVGTILALVGLIMYQPIRLFRESKTYESVSEQINFSGTIYESSQVQPGTFAIIKPWSEVEKWGKGAILSYQIMLSEFKCTAWVPNEETSGTFLKSEFSFRPPEKWNFLTPSKITFDPKTGRIECIPKAISRDSMIAYLVVLGIFTFYLFFYITCYLERFISPFWKIVFYPRVNISIIQ